MASAVHLLFLLVFSNNPIKQVFFFFFSYFTHEKRGAQEGEGLYGHVPRKYMMELGSESSLAVIRVRANILCNLASRNQFQGPLFRAQDSALGPGLSWCSLTSQALRAAQHFHKTSLVRPGPAPERFHGKGRHLVAKQQTHHEAGGSHGLGRWGLGNR